jgi:hypothetical protein
LFSYGFEAIAGKNPRDNARQIQMVVEFVVNFRNDFIGVTNELLRNLEKMNMNPRIREGTKQRAKN